MTVSPETEVEIRRLFFAEHWPAGTSYPDETFPHSASGFIGTVSASYGLSMYCHHSEVPFDGIAVPLDDVEVLVGKRWVPWSTWCEEASAQRRIVICGRSRRDTLSRRERLCGRR
jgi:hypothetical protein